MSNKENSKSCVKVAIIEDNPTYRESLKKIIDDDDRLRLHNEYHSAQAFLNDLNSPFQPDVCLVDVVLKDMSGTECCRIVKAKKPDIHLVIMTAYPSTKSFAEARDIGADYIEKGPRMKAFIKDIISTVSASRAERIFTLTDHDDDVKLNYIKLAYQLEEVKKKVGTLSDNQLKVLQLKRKGKTEKEISEILDMSRATVHTHAKRALKKLQLPDLLDYIIDPISDTELDYEL